LLKLLDSFSIKNLDYAISLDYIISAAQKGLM
jgi:hypothetical protein